MDPTILTGALDIAAALTSALSTVVADFTTNLTAIVPAVLGLAAVVMVWHRVVALVH